MKKILWSSVFVISACSTPTYYYSSKNIGENTSNKKVYILEVGDNIINSKMEKMLYDILKNNNIQVQMMSEAPKKSKPDYIAIARIDKTSYQENRAVPIWGKTGINSIQTNSYTNTHGNLYGGYASSTQYGYNRYNTTGAFAGAYNANSYTNSNTTVNYDYGVTGYQNIVDIHYLTCSIITLRKYIDNLPLDKLKIVHESRICVENNEDDNKFLSYVYDIYNQNQIFIDNYAHYKCEFNGYNGVCKQ